MAMTKDTRPYWEKLRDPRWQKVRLEVMQRENFACEYCGDTEATLNVHHGYYEKGFEPWEYNTDTLHCLCEDCHSKIHDYTHDIYLELARIPVRALLAAFDKVVEVKEEAQGVAQ